MVVKDKLYSNYVLQNEEQFQVKRYTVLAPDILKHMNAETCYVFTLTPPEYYPSQRQSINTLIKAICH
jgi:hypothetical protein